ncbi:alanine and proline-rich secreted protein Apa [Mycobacterium sp.]|uniref:alanine and proline-rich secreted protein Apa n=1 Tax=Mycobacterium sp. TaxID=1785 RepID=UPI0031E1C692
MNQLESTVKRRRRRRGLRAALALAAIAAAGYATIASPPTTATADPAPPPPPAPTATAPAPVNPNAAPDSAPGPGGPDAAPPADDPVAAPPGTDPNAPPPVADPNAPEPARVDNPVGGFSYVVPDGWVESDATHLDYGSALLSKEIGQAVPGQPTQVANDTRVVLGRLDQKLYASAEADNTKAATRLASDMGEFFLPYPGTRFNQENTQLNANGMTGAASYYEVRFSDTSKPNGQIWAGVIGPSAPNAGQAAQAAQKQRWFVVWLGTANDPVDKGGATILAESIRPLQPPPAAPAPGAPAPAPAPAPGAPAPAAPAPGAPAPGAPAPAAPAPGAPPPPGQPAAENAPRAPGGALPA